MQRDMRTLQYLAAMPFLDRLELAAVSDTADRTMHDVVADLKDRRLVASVRHSTDIIASTRRLYVTSLGLRRLAEEEGEDVLNLMQRYPVSRHWRASCLSGWTPLASSTGWHRTSLWWVGQFASGGTGGRHLTQG